ncbi:MAG TPA: lycopene cyclase domain-containing protein [Caldilineaceae bacterium]|nr:lycopene cyclase domain-containing protein [Caldilineaceae bacterium]
MIFTYVQFLIVFLGIPLLLFGLLAWHDARRGRTLPASLHSWPATGVVAAHVVVAVLYTTLWDNYLVATGVWWYDAELIAGIVLGWVPLEEYIFFVVQTVTTSLWLLWLARRLTPVSSPATGAPGRATRIRRIAVATVAALWLTSVALLAAAWRPATYLALILAWALPPVLFQLAFGGDILWRHRNLVAWSLVPATLYLSLADSLAISGGIWTIDPDQSTGLFLGVLPLEEFVFFLLTNTLVVFGVILVLAQESQDRVPPSLRTWLRRLAPGRPSRSVING